MICFQASCESDALDEDTHCYVDFLSLRLHSNERADGPVWIETFRQYASDRASDREPSNMLQRTRDLIYRTFIICHIPPTLLLAVPLVLSPQALPPWCLKPLRLYLATYNDPLPGKKSYPGGWFGGLTLCEVVLQFPYFLWALSIPVGV